MGIKRYELSEAQWVKIAPMLPGVHGGDKPGQWIVGGVSMRAV